MPQTPVHVLGTILLLLGLAANAWAQPESDAPQGDTTGSDTPAEEASEETDDTTGDDKSTQEEDEGQASTGSVTANAIAEADGIPEFERVRTPSSPAFTVLGISPTEIERATTPRDFAIVVASTLQAGEQLNVPQDVAIEVAPYWFFGQKRRTYNDFLKSGVGASALRNLSLSVASSSREVPELDAMGMETGNTIDESKFAVGLRTQLYTGKSRAEICGVDIQKKTLELAKKLASDEELEDQVLTDKNLLTVAQVDTWDAALPHMRARDAARKKVAKAQAIVNDKNASPQAVKEARERLTQASDDVARAQAELDTLLAGRRGRESSIKTRLDDKKRALAGATDDDQRQKLEKEIAATGKQLQRAQAAVAVAEKARELDATQGQEERTQVEAEMKQAVEARDEARKEHIESESEYKKRLSQLKDICKDASAARLGWNLSVAGGLAWLFPESRFDDGDLVSVAGWLTLAHTWKQGITAATLARVSWNRMDDGDRATVFDTGARVIFAHSKFAFSGEAVVRTNTDERGVRAAIAGEYMVSKGKWLTVSFGKDFTDDTGIFTIANLTWGVGGESHLGKQKQALSD